MISLQCTSHGFFFFTIIFLSIISESLEILFCIFEKRRSNLVFYGYVTFAITPIFVETEAAQLSIVFQCTETI